MKIIEILGKLKTVFDIKELKIGDVFSNNNITLIDFSRKTNEVLEVKDEKKLIIDLSRLKPEQLKFIKEEILDKLILEDNEAFLMDRSKNNTELIKKSLPNAEDKDLLKYYKDKLGPTMYKVLDAALIVRNANKIGGNILDLKWGISRKYPDIGNNMCNLVSEGYFHSHFKELYDSMLEEENFNMSIYQDKVKYIVKSLPYIVFVDQHRTYEEILGEVKFKLERLRKYGAGKLVLHALSEVNVETTLKVLGEYKNEPSMRIEVDMDPKKTRITANLIF